MKNLIFLILPMFLLALTSCEKEEIQATGNQKQKDRVPGRETGQAIGLTVPFNLSCQTAGKVVGSRNGVLTLEIDGTGKGVYLGEFTWRAESHVNTTRAPYSQTGEMVFRTANGDRLFGSFTGKGLPTEAGVSFEGTYLITHGSGRFEKSSGSGTYSGFASYKNDSEFAGQLWFDGRLTGL